MIKTSILEKYHKGDLLQYFNNVLEILTVERAEALKVTPQREALNGVIVKFNEAFQPNRGSELTPKIEELDVERDNLFIGIKRTLEVWATYHYEEAKRLAAEPIIEKIKDYGLDIQLYNYQKETATLQSLLNLLNGELKPKITLLGLTEWVDQLQNVNTKFNQMYLERAKAQSKEQEGIVLELRKESISKYRFLVNILEARMEIAKIDNGENIELFETVINELSEITDQYNEAVKRHRF